LYDFFSIFAYQTATLASGIYMAYFGLNRMKASNTAKVYVFFLGMVSLALGHTLLALARLPSWMGGHLSFL
jgi:hypothetical protein